LNFADADRVILMGIGTIWWNNSSLCFLHDSFSDYLLGLYCRHLDWHTVIDVAIFDN
jgi:hypothetical protein